MIRERMRRMTLVKKSERKTFKVEAIGVSKLETEESFRLMEMFISQQTEKIKQNPKIALKYLVETGMYDEEGHLKEEFQ